MSSPQPTDTSAAITSPANPLDLLSRAQMLAEQIRTDAVREVADARREADQMRALTAQSRSELDRIAASARAEAEAVVEAARQEAKSILADASAQASLVRLRSIRAADEAMSIAQEDAARRVAAADLKAHEILTEAEESRHTLLDRTAEDVAAARSAWDAERTRAKIELAKLREITEAEADRIRAEAEVFAFGHLDELERVVASREAELQAQHDEASRERETILEQARAEASAHLDKVRAEADEVMESARTHLAWAQGTVRDILDKTDRETTAQRREHHQKLSTLARTHRERAATLLASATTRAADLTAGAESESERLRATATSVLDAARVDAERTLEDARTEAERMVAEARDLVQDAELRASRRLAEAERGAELVRQSAADDMEQSQREAHEQHRAARAEMVRITDEAQQLADTLRAEAREQVARAREEVATLSARRDAIHTQLAQLSGVIDALAVDDAPQTPVTHQSADGPLPLPTQHHQPQEH